MKDHACGWFVSMLTTLAMLTTFAMTPLHMGLPEFSFDAGLAVLVFFWRNLVYPLPVFGTI
jgi:hypothetical protein